MKPLASFILSLCFAVTGYSQLKQSMWTTSSVPAVARSGLGLAGAITNNDTKNVVLNGDLTVLEGVAVGTSGFYTITSDGEYVWPDGTTALSASKEGFFSDLTVSNTMFIGTAQVNFLEMLGGLNQQGLDYTNYFMAETNHFRGSINASNFFGDGSGLTGISASALALTNLTVHNQDSAGNYDYLYMPSVYPYSNTYKANMRIGQKWTEPNDPVNDIHPNVQSVFYSVNFDDQGNVENTNVAAHQWHFESDWSNAGGFSQSELYMVHMFPYSTTSFRPFYFNFIRSTNKTSSASKAIHAGLDVAFFRIGNQDALNQSLVQITTVTGANGRADMTLRGTLTVNTGLQSSATISINQGFLSVGHPNGYGTKIAQTSDEWSDTETAISGGSKWTPIVFRLQDWVLFNVALSNQPGIRLLPVSSTVAAHPYFANLNETNKVVSGFNTAGYGFVTPGGRFSTNARAAVYGGSFRTDNTAVGNVGAGEDNLITFTIPGSTLAGGGSWDFDTWGTFAANVNTKRVRVYYGSAVIMDTTALVLNNRSWRCTGRVARISDTAQTATATFTISATLLAAEATSVSQTTAITQSVTTNTLFAVTGEDSGGVPVNDSIVQNGMWFGWSPSQGAN